MKPSRTITISCLLAVFISLGAQNTPDPKNIMEKVSKKLQSYQSLQADFSFTLSNPEEEINDTHEGSLILSGEKYKLQLMGTIAICNGETLWTINEELKEANILDPDENELFNPKNIFTLYEKDFKYEWVSNSGDKAVIDLFPLNREETYSKIRMTIIKSRDQIDQVTYFSTDGNQYQIKIKKMNPDYQVDAKMFTYDPARYPGVKVYDMR